ncbi:hypothetical protein HYY70_07045 [Candidatus Woesearchaeota archaeon]|nr:hypothetical protein [Candidatus Woesearchaeota archaeon]
MKIRHFLVLVVVFLVGWLGSGVYNSYYNHVYFDEHSTAKHNSDEIGELSGISQTHRNTENLTRQTIVKLESLARLDQDRQNFRDKPSPSEWIKNEDILVYENEVIIKMEEPLWAIFTDTKSMDPVIDSTSKAIEATPKSEKDINVGDIVAYQSKYKEGIVTHRVVETGYDGDGWYAILKGDNNESPDPGKIRFGQIKRIVVAVIY